MSPSEPEIDQHTGAVPRDFQDTDLANEFRYKSGISGKRTLRCESINQITYKITDGQMTRVPASHGQWGGYNTSRALSWVINVGMSSAAWLARSGDHVAGPLSFKEAKAAAVKLAKGADGDYRIQNPIAHLNGLQARLINAECVR